MKHTRGWFPKEGKDISISVAVNFINKLLINKIDILCEGQNCLNI